MNKILELCAQIPSGKVTTYGELARATNTRPRAVGAILSRNFDPLIPCHRVVNSDGSIGGYNRGVEKKLALLLSEGVVIKGRKVDLEACGFEF